LVYLYATIGAIIMHRTREEQPS